MPSEDSVIKRPALSAVKCSIQTSVIAEQVPADSKARECGEGLFFPVSGYGINAVPVRKHMQNGRTEEGFLYEIL